VWRGNELSTRGAGFVSFGGVLFSPRKKAAVEVLNAFEVEGSQFFDGFSAAVTSGAINEHRLLAV
jgi:hypothetical protein